MKTFMKKAQGGDADEVAQILKQSSAATEAPSADDILSQIDALEAETEAEVAAAQTRERERAKEEEQERRRKQKLEEEEEERQRGCGCGW